MNVQLLVMMMRVDAILFFKLSQLSKKGIDVIVESVVITLIFVDILFLIVLFIISIDVNRILFFLNWNNLFLLLINRRCFVHM